MERGRRSVGQDRGQVSVPQGQSGSGVTGAEGEVEVPVRNQGYVHRSIVCNDLVVAVEDDCVPVVGGGQSEGHGCSVVERPLVVDDDGQAVGVVEEFLRVGKPGRGGGAARLSTGREPEPRSPGGDPVPIGLGERDVSVPPLPEGRT